ncbi:MAG: uracil-DNA glycosylase [Flavobacteriia bacterium]|nr:uracil-DNA glycosylase [Flavobacteriia bacterium]
MRTYVPKRWLDAILTQVPDNQLSILFNNIDEAYKTDSIFPPKHLVFNALELCDPAEIKVVVVGQDPYHGAGQAHGLSFSVPNGVKIPPSLRNIFKEVERSTNSDCPKNGNLESWAKQGVLLLNTSLTVEEGKPASHSKLGWQKFTDAVLQIVSQRGGVVYMLWGKHAEDKAEILDSSKNLILKAPHPSPLSAHKGFLGCNHFVEANTYLVNSGKSPIKWCDDSQPNLFSNL